MFLTGSPGSAPSDKVVTVSQKVTVTVDGDGSILVADVHNCHIQKFESDGKFIIAVGKRGNKPLMFEDPVVEP